MTNEKIRKQQQALNSAMAQTLHELGLIEIRKQRMTLQDPDLEGFVEWFFADELQVVQAYRVTRSIGAREECEAQHDDRVGIIPFDYAVAAATEAAQKIKDPWQKQAVYAASLLDPCGIFLSHHPVVQLQRVAERTLAEERAMIKKVMLERPLNWLSNRSTIKGNLMRHLLGQPVQEAAIPPTWERLKKVVVDAQMQIRLLW
jgi:hypothetical protein